MFYIKILKPVSPLLIVIEILRLDMYLIGISMYKLATCCYKRSHTFGVSIHTFVLLSLSQYSHWYNVSLTEQVEEFPLLSGSLTTWVRVSLSLNFFMIQFLLLS